MKPVLQRPVVQRTYVKLIINTIGHLDNGQLKGGHLYNRELVKCTVVQQPCLELSIVQMSDCTNSHTCPVYQVSVSALRMFKYPFFKCLLYKCLIIEVSVLHQSSCTTAQLYKYPFFSSSLHHLPWYAEPNRTKDFRARGRNPGLG